MLEVYELLEVPKAVQSQCSMCRSVSACNWHMFLVAPSLLLDSITMVQDTLSKQPVASLLNVANVVFVVIAML